MEDQANVMQLSSYNEDLQHKTILVGDSSVGKTSLLVQFDQGKFIPGSFTSTVGIGFTEYGIPFMETSAKTGVNVELAFMAVAKELKQRSSSPDDHKFQIHQYIESQKKKSGCCGLL
ncbi:ras-related protein Rab-37-like [Anomaloglossus baeobatrachus]